MFLCNISILMNFYAAYKSRSPSTCMFLHSFQFRIQSLGPRANMEALGRYICLVTPRRPHFQLFITCLSAGLYVTSSMTLREHVRADMGAHACQHGFTRGPIWVCVSRLLLVWNPEQCQPGNHFVTIFLKISKS